MKYFILLTALMVICFKAAGVDCGEIPTFDQQFIDLDGDGADDVRYAQNIGVIANDPPPSKRAVRFVNALSPARFLRSKGTQLDFALGQAVSSANAVQANSGVSEIDLTYYFTINYSGFYECHYMDTPNTWNALTNGIAGVRLQQDDGFHYGWIRFARPDLEPSTPFAVVDHDWNPVPGAPIGAGEPPALPALQTMLGETGLTLTWDARFPNLQLEWAAAITEPVDWHPVEDAGAGTALLPPAETNRFFRLRKL